MFVHAYCKINYLSGWTREVNYRKPTAARKNYCDIYYCHFPNKTKFRSLNDIQKYLELPQNKNIPLIVDYFTFNRNEIGLNDESKEIIKNKSRILLELAVGEHIFFRSNPLLFIRWKYK